MGEIADIWEDNMERHGPYGPGPSYWPFRCSVPLPSDYEPAVPESGTRPTCHLCSDQFSSEEALQDHLFSRHRSIGCYLLVNGRVYCDGAVRVSELPDSIGIVVIADPPTSVSISARQTYGTQLTVAVPVEPGKLVNLSDSIGVGEGIVSCEVSVRHPERVFLIDVTENLPVDYERLGAAVSVIQHESAQDELGLPLSALWKARSELLLAQARNVREREYVMAHYDYLYAHALESRPGADSCVDALRLFEQCFAALRTFEDPRSAAVARAIAFRLNWFRHPALNRPESVFYLPMLFFASSFDLLGSYASHATDRSLSMGTQRPNNTVLIDDFNENVVMAVHSLIRDDYDAAFHHLSLMRDDPRRELAAAFRDKLLLLSARFYRSVGRVHDAVECYEELVDHTDFGQEARGFARH